MLSCTINFSLLRAIELISLYFLLPLVFYFQWLDKAYFLPVLFIILVYVIILLGRDKRFTIKQLWQITEIKYLKIIILRFIFAIILLTAFTYYFYPELFLRFPTQRPQLWLIVMLLYPILSAYPQEIISRAFFFQRYADFFPNINILIIVNAILFAWMHILFANWIAIILSLIGGLFFAHTYQQTRSVLLVTIEHALYGNFLFTIGLGWFFYHGN